MVNFGGAGASALREGGQRAAAGGVMLRTYFVQQWFNLSDPGVEEAMYESAALRRFVGVDLGMAPAPDETTILRFRHLLEKHDLGGLMLDAVTYDRSYAREVFDNVDVAAMNIWDDCRVFTPNRAGSAH